ncbi:FAD-dependent monooxygenase [Staphylococcus sp. Marseille-Q5304]|uniref:FAD-dependent oxidoreductase n=1 Tax=Staphylococcus sp. Marseille-Q5304 TaxID=2942200 RepID=UPI00255CF4E5|nr:FAD-dependent monooxygenase [Staphylococcus sp. Marseille-Q5304]
MAVNKNHKIAIIGGGPGGLMLGLLLQNAGYQFTIFEKGEPTINSERGGSLDIHEESGQVALKEAGILEEFKKLARYDGEDTKIVGKDGTVYYEETAEGEGGRPEIDRGELCDLIRTHIDSSHIQYGYKFKSLEQFKNGQVEITFNENEKQIFDFVMGVDGAFSKVRPYLTSTDIEYTGISMIEINIDDVKNKYPDLAAYNKNGKMMALDQNQALLAQLNGDGRIKVYASYRMDYDKLDDYKKLSPSELKQQLLRDFHDWDASLLQYIESMNDDILFRRIYKLPISLTWESNGSISLMGDAAHVMSPFAGEGVNAALYDAYLFVEALKQKDTLYPAIQYYEQEMYKHSRESAQGSQDNLERMFSQNAAEKLGELFK